MHSHKVQVEALAHLFAAERWLSSFYSPLRLLGLYQATQLPAKQIPIQPMKANNHQKRREPSFSGRYRLHDHRPCPEADQRDRYGEA